VERAGFGMPVEPCLQIQQVLPPVGVAVVQMSPPVLWPARQFVEVGHAMRHDRQAAK
jgi:hypothetical protein